MAGVIDTLLADDLCMCVVYDVCVVLAWHLFCLLSPAGAGAGVGAVEITSPLKLHLNTLLVVVTVCILPSLCAPFHPPVCS